MSQRVAVAPFHRRVLPWIFIVVFLAVAPAVVFYTAGYRYNSKKGKVERNGTVILDTVPTGATVTIDAQPYTSKTPVTIQDMAPGIHRFDFQKSGYRGWGKSLDVHSELVTFANNIWLWKDTTPRLQTPADIFLLSAAPDRKSVLELIAATPTQAFVLDDSASPSATFSFAENVATGSRAIWAPGGRYVLIEAPQGSGAPSWLVDTRAAHAPEELPAGNYRWENNALVGAYGMKKLSISMSDFAVSTVSLPRNTVDATSAAMLETAPGTNQLVYVANNDTSRGFILPAGAWRFWSSFKNGVLLRDGARWLSLETSTQPPEYRTASGDMLRPFSGTSGVRELLVNGTEIWTWDPGNDKPTLIYRQSDTIKNAEWHDAGYDLFFATDHDIYALNLDARDGYLLTPLAHFDSITNFTALTKQLFIAGTKDGQTGLWTLDLQ